MSRFWKVLVGALFVYSLALTWAFVDMMRYLQWLHFNESSAVRVDSMIDTSPGRDNAILLGVVGGACLIALFVTWLRQVKEEADREELGEPKE